MNTRKDTPEDGDGWSDDDVGDWFQRTARPHSPGELADWNQFLLTRGPETEEKRASFRTQRDRLDPSRTDITGWADLLDLEEGRHVPKRSTPSP